MNDGLVFFFSGGRCFLLFFLDIPTNGASRRGQSLLDQLVQIDGCGGGIDWMDDWISYSVNEPFLQLRHHIFELLASKPELPVVLPERFFVIDQGFEFPLPILTTSLAGLVIQVSHSAVFHLLRILRRHHGRTIIGVIAGRNREAFPTG